ncbi:N-acetylmuramoyl-L-alanine amidase [Photobacterium frigidiphilum]|uniref:N-acetylmuramoyl-L-alanine amidase n=1 Tax=Photobacterium frigidiphilum TaxID=264736 RepID=UPI003D101D84
MKTIALIIGHSAKRGGAANKTHGINEFQFNEPLAHCVAEKLMLYGFDPIIVYRDSSYSKLPKKVNQTGADIAVSFHCNAFNDKANGSETLYYKYSLTGLILAASIQKEVVQCLGLKNRGLKPCVASYKGKAGNRGGLLLQKTSMPCVIVEPFFIDSDSSLELVQERFEDLAKAYALGIKNFFSGDV